MPPISQSDWPPSKSPEWPWRLIITQVGSLQSCEGGAERAAAKVVNYGVGCGVEETKNIVINANMDSLSGQISDVVKMFQLKRDFSTFLYVVSTIFFVCTLCYHQKLPIGLEVAICGDAS